MDSLRATFLIALAASVGLCAMARIVLHRRRRVINPPEPVPWAGAAAWAAALYAAYVAGFLRPESAVARVLLVGTVAHVLGIVAERLSLVPGRLLRWATAVGCAGALAALGITVASIGPTGAGGIALGPASAALSALWMLSVIMLVLLANRGEGMVSGVGAISSVALLTVAALTPSSFGIPEDGRVLCALMAGALIPATALGLAFPRARFGGGAALSVGVALASATVLGYLKQAGAYTIAAPILALGAPMVGAILAWGLSRRAGARGLRPERAWPSFLEVFIARGMAPRSAVAFLLCWHAYLCMVALLLSVLRLSWATAPLATLLVLAGSVLFYVSFQIVYGGRRPMPAKGDPASADRVRILDVEVDRLSVEETLRRIEGFIVEGGHHLIVTLDAGGCLRARTDPDFGDIVRNASLVTPDGAGVVLAARLLDEPFRDRVSGCDLLCLLSEMAAQRGYGVYLLGAKPETLAEARTRLEDRYPGLRVVGSTHGFFGPEEESEVVAKIMQAKPDMLFVAFGLPAQEKWIARHSAELGVPVCMGVGGSFDVISGRVARAPMWVRRIWCEFLWRSLGSPKRMGRIGLVIRFFIALALDAPRRIMRGK